MFVSKSIIDTVFDLLANRRRRYALYYIDQQSETVITLDELSAQVVEWEQQWGDATETSADELQNDVRVTLHHNHLPRIADAGLIEYDARSETVRCWDEPSLVAWAQMGHDEFPHLWALFCTSITEGHSIEAAIPHDTKESNPGRYHLLNEAKSASLCGSINTENQFAADIYRRLSQDAAERSGMTLCGRCLDIANQ